MSFVWILWIGLFGSMNTPDWVEKQTPSLVCIFPADGSGGGSGVVISEDGWVLTNFHVAQPCGAWMKCGMADGSITNAVLVGLDPVGDVALIRLLPQDPKKKFIPAKLGNSDRLRVGDEVLVLGNPFMFAGDFTPSVSMGILSGVHRYQYPAGTLLEYADCLQTDAAINPGNSGGPMFNRAGELVGINGRCSFEKRGRINVGVGYAISINQIKMFLSHLAAGRIVDHATLGATVTDDDLGRPVVDEIRETSDAALKGLEPGDRITRLGNRSVRTPNDFKNVLGTFPKGWVVPLEFVRRTGSDTFEEHKIVVRLEGVHNDTELADLLSQDFEKDEKTPKKTEKMEKEPSEEEKILKELSAKLKDLPPELASFYNKRDGWANDHFNQAEKKRIWTRFTNGERGKKEFHLTGKTSTGATFSLDVTPDKTFLRLPDGENFWANTGDFTKAADPPESGLILPGLTLWTQIRQANFAGWKSLDAWGADGEDGVYDALFGNVGGLDVRVCFTRTTPARLAVLELAAYDGGFPWEFLFDTGKITIRRGTTVLETLTYETTETVAKQPPATPPVAEGIPSDNGCPQAFDKMLKVYGAGGFAGLEDYQSGCFLSADGLILTAFSPSLDTDDLRCVTQDGTRYTAEFVGADPVLEIALLKIDANDTPFFDLSKTVEESRSGTEIFAFSNLFNVAVGNEPVSVQRGHIADVISLDATHGVYPSRYHGKVLVLDVTTNNPGAAGGALVSKSGEFLGMLGKELQHAKTGEWLNYAIPTSVLVPAIQAIREGKAPTEDTAKTKPERAWTVEKLGIRLVPEVLEKTPPYVDEVKEDAPFLPDDLVLYVNGKLVSSIVDLRDALDYIDVVDSVKISVLRDGNIVEMVFPQ